MLRKYYLAYGSNLNIKEMLLRCPSSTPVGTTILYNYRLVFKGSCEGNAYLTIEKSEGSYVPLGIFKLSIFDENELDLYEAYPELYSKKTITLNINGKKAPSLIYKMNEGFDYHLPSSEYFKRCLVGYKDFGFNPELLKKAIVDTTLAKNQKKK